MKLEIEVLGRFTVRVDGREIAASGWRRGRAAALVKLLAITPQHRLHREQIMEMFWPELDADASGANLRKAIHFARKVLGARDAVMVERDTVALAAGATPEIDANRFMHAAKAALQTGDPDACAAAAALYGGLLLPDDLYAEWLHVARENLRQMHVRLLRQAGLWRELIAVEPADEQAQCALMQAALSAGNRSEAIRLFNQLRDYLHIELGIGPSKAALALYEEALALTGLEPVSPADRLRAALARGLVHLQSGEFDRAAEMARQVRQQALAAKLAREVGEASALLALAARMQGRWHATFHDELVLSIQQNPDLVPALFDGNLCLAEFCLCTASGPADAAGLAQDLLRVADAAGSTAGRGLASLILGEVALFAGNLERANDLLSDAVSLLLDKDVTAGHVLALERLAEVSLQRGEGARARRLVRHGLDRARQSWLSPHLVIRMKALELRCTPVPSKARSLIAEGDRMLSSDLCQPCSMAFRTESAIALAEAGELEDLDRRLNEAERIAGMWHGGPWTAALWEARGVQRRAQGKGMRAAAAFSEAAARYEELGRPIDRQRCAMRLEEAMKTAG